jgi:hypothetical protein
METRLLALKKTTDQTMNRLAILLVVFALATLGGCDKSLRSYLPKHLESDSYYENLFRILSDYDVPSSPDKVREQLKGQTSADGQVKEVLDALVELSNVTDATCSNTMIKVYLDVLELIERCGTSTDEVKADFVNKYQKYMKSVGREKFTKCATKALENFDQLIKDSYGVDAAKESFDSMAQQNGELLENVEDSMVGECLVIRDALGNTFDTYNLARILVKSGAESQLPQTSDRFAKLNNYNRICLARFN